MPLAAQVTRVMIHDYKSIVACDVELGPLNFLVGPNGSGKSNFLDALRFIADCLNHSVELALRDRGGIGEVRRRSDGRPRHFGVGVRFRAGVDDCSFSFEIGAREGGGFVIQRETFEMLQGAAKPIRYEVRSGRIVRLEVPMYKAADVPGSPEGFLLGYFSGHVRRAHRVLSAMAFYRLEPDKLRDLQIPASGELLARDGSNAAAVLANIAKHHEDDRVRIEEFLGAVAPGTRRVSVKALGPRETLEFEEVSPGSSRRRRFYAASMSDGTLRAFGILLALFQSQNGNRGVSLIGIEEPETALHPAAAGTLLDALREASENRQVIITSHSPDLLDSARLRPESILAVAVENGVTAIGPIRPEERRVIQRKLKTAGELLRQNQLTPGPAKAPRS